MSKVDLTVFQELADEYGISVEKVVLELAEGDLCDLFWPEEYTIYEEACKFRSIKCDEYGYEHLQQEGGGEGGAEYCWGVFRLKGVVYKAEWSYYSYHGYEYDEIADTLRIVKPVEKTITVWE